MVQISIRFMLLCALVVPALPNQAEQEISDSIEIRETVLFHDRSEVNSLCRAGYEVRGCTDFPTPVFNCDCVRAERGWIIEATAKLEALVHLSSPRILNHERQHLEDVRSGIAERFAVLASTVYPSERSCRHMAAVFSSQPYVTDVLNRILQDSMKKRQCRLRPV